VMPSQVLKGCIDVVQFVRMPREPAPDPIVMR
jgi:hypothetical protein